MNLTDRSLTHLAFAGLLAVSLSLVGTPSATAGIINFDAIDTTGGQVTGPTINTYLSGFGVTVSRNADHVSSCDDTAHG